MSELIYPIRVVFCGGHDWDGIPLNEYEVHGPFNSPGDLWRWANRDCYLNAYHGWRDDISTLIRESAARGWSAIKSSLDEWAIQELQQSEYGDGSRARLIQGDVAWQEWQRSENVERDALSEPPDDWRPVGPVCSCGCEDWPCCIHADDFVHVADTATLCGLPG
jgi:hypothetical protein